MKHKLITLVLAALFAATQFASAQLDPNKMLEAGDAYLNGINTEVNYEKAFDIFSQLAKMDNAEAINRLAGMYKHGFGVEQNLDSAIACYHRAANLGSGKASYNLGNLIRQGEGMEQNFKLAFDFFYAAYIQGYIPAVCAVGYMHFKGLGVEQDYEQALAYFYVGSAFEIPECVYFVGLCHIGGYGVPQNINAGMEYMQQALLLGSDAAEAFISENRVEQYRPAEGELRSARRPHNPHRRVRNHVKDELSGRWEGKLLQYDWSGKKVEKEHNLSLQLTFSNDSLTGTWVQDDSTAISVTGHLQDTVWVFDNMIYIDQKLERPWEIRSGGFQLQTDESGVQQLEGSVEQYSSQTKEPAEPVALVLTRTAKAEKGKDSRGGAMQSSSLTVNPNPFDRELRISFTLTDEQDVNVRVYDVDGQIACNTTKRYPSGSHTENLVLDVPQGAYCVSVKGQSINLTSLVIKK